MDDPTLAEMIRALQRDVSQLLANQQLYVTQEQRTADQKVYELQLKAVADDQKEDRARLDSMSRWFWTAVAGPVIVGVVLYFLIGGKP